MTKRISTLFFLLLAVCRIVFSQSIPDIPVLPEEQYSIPDKVEVGPTGAATYSIPLEMPPGTNGFQPSLLINYNSQSGYGMLGIGWNVSGLSKIERGSKNFYHDETVKRNGITFTDEDQLYLDGQRLILLSGQHFREGAVYGFEVENYARVTIKKALLKSGNKSHTYFELKTLDGKVFNYGLGNSSIVSDSKSHHSNFPYKGAADAICWKLSSAKDIDGNEISYIYSNGGMTLDRIYYAGTIVYFSYAENTKNPQRRYVGDFELVNDKLLVGINIRQGSTDFRKYVFDYEDKGTVRRLNTISLYAWKPEKSKDDDDSSLPVYPGDDDDNIGIGDEGIEGPKGDFELLGSTFIEWGSIPEIENIELFGLNPPDYDQMYIGDIDGNGRKDHIYLIYSKNNNYFNIKYENDGNLREIYFSPIGESVTFRIKPNILIQDIDLDGKDEIVLLYQEVIDAERSNLKSQLRLKLFTYDENKKELVEKQDLMVSNMISFFDTWHQVIPPFFSYVNDDIYPDLRIIVYNRFIYKHNIYIGEYVYDSGVLKPLYNTDMGTIKPVTVSDSYNWRKSVLGDFDGNGVLDLFHGKSASLVNNVINYSDKFNIIESGVWRVWQDGHQSSSEGNDWIDRAVPYGIDINGDNRTDLLIQYQEQNNHSWRVLINNGINGIPKMEHIDIIEASCLNQWDNDYKIPIDYNGDGLMDFVVADECYEGKRFIRTRWWFYRNYNGELVLDRVFETPYEISYKSNEERVPVVADINNDGVNDIVYYENGRLKAFTMYGASKTNLVHKMTSGKNKAYEFTYKNHDNYSNPGNITEPQYEGVKILNTPLLVVDILSINNSQEKQYNYGKILFDNKKGFIGFDEIVERNYFNKTDKNDLYPVELLNYTVTEMLFAPMLDINLLQSSNSYKYLNLMLKEKNVYKYRRLPGGLQLYEPILKTTYENRNIPISDLRYIPVTTSIAFEDHINNFKKTTNYTYSGTGMGVEMSSKPKGTLLSEEVIQGEYIKRTEYSDFDREHKGIVEFLPKTKTVTYSKNSEKIAYRTNYEYDSKYRIIKQTDYANLPEQVVTEYEYYPHGNLRKTTVSVPGLPTQTDTYEYDKRFRLPTRTANSLGQTTERVYDFCTGNILIYRDIDGSVTKYKYNTKGRLCKKSLPTGQTVEYESRYTKPEGADYFVSESYSPEPLSNTTVVYNKFDEEIERSETGPNGKILFGEKSYDYRHRLYKEVGLHTKNDQSPPYTEYSYDHLDRIKSKTVFDGLFTNRTEYTYSGRTTTVTDAEDGKQISKTTLNDLGLVESKTDRGGTIYYTYNAEGKPVSISAGGATTEFKYDGYGNRVSIKDPSAGTIVSSYYANGLLKSQTNAKGDRTTFEYDALGRQTKETETEAANKYVYDYEYTYVSGANGKGQIERIVLKENGTAKHTQDFTYNDKHLITKLTDTYKGDKYERAFEYDKYWQLIRETSPSGLVKENVYNRYGEVIEIKAADQTVWKLEDYDAKGNIRRFGLGNQIYTEYRYKKNNLLESIVTRCGLAKIPIQDVRYDYDRHYNLIQRNDVTLHKNETFRYDDLDRLTDIRLNGGEGNSIWYQPNGNIFQKYDVGRYIYDPIRPFAVSYIGSASKGISDTEQRLTYNAYNKVTLVAQGDTQYSIVYGLDRQRIESVLKDKGKVKYTRLYMGSYERKTSANGVVTHVDYIYAPTGLAAIHKRTGTRQGTYYVLTDNIGSVSVVTDGFGNIINRYYYTAWGGRVRTDNGEYDHATYFGDEGGDVTDRGYTCHEHLTPLNLIDMNGRIYDPVLARFLSPDPYIQAPDFTQNYNRYAYCLNNPFKYTDPSGEWALLDDVIAAVVGGVINLTVNLIQGNVKNVGHGFALFGVGAAGGLASLYVSPIVGAGFVSGANSFLNQGFNTHWQKIDAGQVFFSMAMGAGTSYLGGALGSALSQPISRVTSEIASPIIRETLTQGVTNASVGFTMGAGMALIGGAKFKDAMKQGGIGALTGLGIGIMNGTVSAIQYASKNDVNLWTGKSKAVETNTLINENNSMSLHANQRVSDRHVEQKDIKETLNNPLKITKIKYDSQGLPSIRYIGHKATVVLNPETGKIITVYPTSTQRLNNILKNK